MTTLTLRYHAAVHECERLEHLLHANKLKSTGDWWRLHNARSLRDELLALLMDVA